MAGARVNVRVIVVVIAIRGEPKTPNGNGHLSPDPNRDHTRLSLLFDDNDLLDAERCPRLHLHLLLARRSVSVSKSLRLWRISPRM